MRLSRAYSAVRCRILCTRGLLARPIAQNPRSAQRVPRTGATAFAAAAARAAITAAADAVVAWLA